MLMILESVLTLLFEEYMREKVLLVIAQINLLLCQVTDMLDLIQLDQGKFRVRWETFSPRDAFHFVLNMFTKQSQIQSSGLELQEIEDALPDRLVGDSTRFKQVLINMIKNALKFSKGHIIRIKASFDRQ